MSKGLHPSRQSATAKLETFPYTRYGTVVAHVDVVSADAVTDEKKGSYCPAVLTLSQKDMAIELQRLVVAQDTGSAIVGALRADYFVGWGAEAGELAGRLKQPLRMWVLWPKRP